MHIQFVEIANFRRLPSTGALLEGNKYVLNDKVIRDWLGECVKIDMNSGIVNAVKLRLP